ncbi:MAG: pyridoxamine 5'-phosphate oxidase family protein [Acidobacteriia bacterium]|nr:pyridoxamine 5'-phosphate oxidase family protein [Terriglobia bacterium]
MTKEQIFDFMSNETLAVLGSISPEGLPQAALVGIAVTPDLEIIFDTVKSSRKYRNLTANRAASFVVGTTREITVQFEGVATELSGEDLARYQKIYFAKWPDGPSRLSWPGICYFVVRPRWVRYNNFDRRPPEIVEFEC